MTRVLLTTVQLPAWCHCHGYQRGPWSLLTLVAVHCMWLWGSGEGRMWGCEGMVRGGMERVRVGGCEAYETFTHDCVTETYTHTHLLLLPPPVPPLLTHTYLQWLGRLTSCFHAQLKLDIAKRHGLTVCVCVCVACVRACMRACMCACRRRVGEKYHRERVEENMSSVTDEYHTHKNVHELSHPHTLTPSPLAQRTAVWRREYPLSREHTARSDVPETENVCWGGGL